MKRFIRNLLVGSVSFLPLEKVLSDSSVEGRNFSEEADALFEQIERGEYETSSAGTEAIEELLRIIQDEEANVATLWMNDSTSNNIPEGEVCSEVSTNLVSSEDKGTEVLSDVSKTDTQDYAKEEPVILESASEAQKDSSNIETLPSEGFSDGQEDSIAVEPVSEVKEEAPVSNEKAAQDYAKEEPVIPESVSEAQEDSSNVETLPNEGLSDAQMLPSGTNEQFSSEEDNSIPLDLTTELNILLTNQQTKIQSSKQFNAVIQKDLSNLEQDETLISKNDNLSLKESHETPIEKKTWFPLAMSSLFGVFLIGTIWLAGKFETLSKKKESSLQRPGMGAPEGTVTESIENTPIKDKHPMISGQNISNKNENKTDSEQIKIDGDSHQKGVKMLANIKLRRADINRQMKALRMEKMKLHQSDPRFLEIVKEMDVLQDVRNQLTREHRIARTLIKGKEGKRIQDERYLLAKEMRLAKKTNDAERIDKIMRKRLAIKQQEKQILSEALKEVKERQEKASRWQGIRLFQEVHSEEKALKERIKQLKKETGLKQKEILELEESLNNQHKKIKAKKSLARKKVKRSSFTAKRRILSQQIIMAHNNNDVETENRLKGELQNLKQAEKTYIKEAENIDYIKAKHTDVPVIKKRTEEAAKRKRTACRNIRDVRMAQFLRGLRMLHDLSAGQVESVNLNQRSAADYKKEALSLIGKRRLFTVKNERFV